MHTMGLRRDGKVVATGYRRFGSLKNQCSVDDWRDIIAISAGEYHSVGLRSDGRIFAVGENEYGEAAVDEWSKITAIAAGFNYTIGIQQI